MRLCARTDLRGFYFSAFGLGSSSTRLDLRKLPMKEQYFCLKEDVSIDKSERHLCYKNIFKCEIPDDENILFELKDILEKKFFLENSRGEKLIRLLKCLRLIDVGINITGTIDFIAITRDSIYQPKIAPLPDTLQLSPHLVLSKNKEGWMLQSTLNSHPVLLKSSFAIKNFTRLLEGKIQTKTLNRKISLFYSHLFSLGFFHKRPNLCLSYIENQDYFFHRETQGGHNECGGTFRLHGVLPAPATRATIPPGEEVLLDKSEEMDDFSRLASQRKTHRHYNEASPLTQNEVSHYLQRTLAEKKSSSDMIARPYPSPGCLHAMEFYLVVNNIQGLKRGLYRYDTEKHRLIFLHSRPCLNKVLEDSPVHAFAATLPQAVLILTGRISRLSFKYEKIAYRLLLLEAGVILQNLYLAATTLRVGVCPHGACHSSFLEEEVLPIKQYEELALLEVSFGSIDK